MNFHTADLCDKYHSDIVICSTKLNSYGKQTTFYGPIATVDVLEDNGLVEEAIESVLPGTVLVVNGKASLNRALVGGNLAAKAAARGLAGLIIYGGVRDVHELRECDLGVLALGSVPLRPTKTGAGTRNNVVYFGNVAWLPQDYVYVDEDGIVVAKRLFI